MPKKTSKKPKKSNFEKEINKEVKEIEDWMKERKKFLVKLGWVAGFVIVLLIVSHYYLRVKGFG